MTTTRNKREAPAQAAGQAVAAQAPAQAVVSTRAVYQEAAAANTKKKTVWAIGTGGTISSWGSPRLTFTEYGVGGQKLDIFGNLARIPEVRDFVNVKAEQMFMEGSGNIGDEGWLKISKRINDIFQNEPSTAGLVVTHGTSTLEEMAYWLNLTVHTEKPVVVTGTMRPPSALGTEADNNLLGALVTAASDEARRQGVLVLLDDHINAAREVTKTNSYRVDTFQTRELGMLGYFDSDLRPVFYRSATRKHTYQSEFQVSDLDTLPQVEILYSYEGVSGMLAQCLMDHNVPGIVIAGTGAGGAGREQTEVLREAAKKGIVVVAASRVGSGRVIRTGRHRTDGWVAGDNLQPQKARILLKLALTKTKDPEDIQRMFDTY